MDRRRVYKYKDGCGWLALGCLLVAGLSGCEQGNGLDELRVTPSSVVLTPGSNTVDFAVGEDTNATPDSLALPLKWSVSDPSLGTILHHSGWTARYQRSGRDGENVVTVEDQFGQKGYARVKQTRDQYTLALTASPNPIPFGSDTCTIVVSGGVLPYSWWVQDPSLGVIVRSAGDTAVYRSQAPGENVVEVRDAHHVHGLIVIIQED